jgi:hypothetical protein
MMVSFILRCPIWCWGPPAYRQPDGSRSRNIDLWYHGGDSAGKTNVSTHEISSFSAPGSNSSIILQDNHDRLNRAAKALRRGCTRSQVSAARCGDVRRAESRRTSTDVKVCLGANHACRLVPSSDLTMLGISWPAPQR